MQLATPTVRTASARKAFVNIDAELQKLVDAEFDELANQPRSARKQTADVQQAAPAGEFHDELPAELSVAADTAGVALPFSADEEAFISNAAAFLEGRKNADMLIEAITTRALREVAIPAAETLASSETEGGDDA
jgi:hypothetical protein